MKKQTAISQIKLEVLKLVNQAELAAEEKDFVTASHCRAKAAGMEATLKYVREIN